MQYASEDISVEAFQKRVQERMELLDIKPKQLAQLISKNESTLKNVIYKSTECNRTMLIQLARALQTTVEYLATGALIADADETINLAVYTPESLAISQGFSEVQRTSRDSDLPIRSLPLPKRLIQSYGVDPDKVRAVYINSDALSKILDPGNIALVDTDTKFLHEGSFLICFRNTVIMRLASPVTSGFALSATNGNIVGTAVTVDQNGMLSNKGMSVIGKIFLRVNLSRV
ncbi:helix-turn-helix domain-containing protein [Pseudomonas aeruginosa]|uniref:helix-turn-helix domain-containing protein n=1 Tax=Pseudomonas aeruginosa TaxID=287 RepID=UPI000E6A8A0C|nr:helix-turn-helix transcriptional regulator [Pseudomonas aeruginosa]MBA5107697.1 helix-turn-helix transcriptional regulator [Pseudomonas aeruginosa]MBD1300148.1 helix-turn-helix transcriptional regulator [Pseudomonas aeruginosa]MBD1340713.1 helix-turn-helix transcriptional regulator [Pseudomonas aeruginosa]MBG4604286.1 helix-turn-helix transcriptional regulator [Pseudomonas aeruginosa]MBH3592839.1 helix-turn-helix transcriptional regulator [Pseudomonas aeruginosa]